MIRMIKKSFLGTAAIIAAIATTGCGGSADKNYSVTFPVLASSEGEMAYLVNFDTGEHIDSLVINGSELTFTGSTDKPVLARLLVNGQRKVMFVLEPGTLAVDSTGKVTGTELNERFNSFDTFYRGLVEKMQALPQDSTSAEVALALEKEFNDERTRLMAENSDNPLGYYLFLQDAYSFTPEQLDSALTANPSMEEYKRVKDLRKAAECKRATMPGCKFTDFEVTYNDSTMRLSDYVGKGRYTLVDFWASWCGPCIRETAVIKDLYKQYGGAKGLDVVGVAVWDEPDNTLKAIETHELPWPNIINAQTIPTDLYGISSIPCIILFAPDGTIVSRDLQDEALRQSVAEAMGAATK